MSGTDPALASAPTRRRDDIQGLRAVAVALVVLFHAGLSWLPGGYVGVDVFFVISGFLITGLLAREWSRSGRLALGAFYARRIRRLLPASALVLVFTLVASWLIFPPLAMQSVADAGKATALYVSNIWFASQATEYLADATPSPLLHYWSLGVEEQFYLFWPLLMAGIWLFAARGRATARLAFGLLAVVVVGSFVFNLWLTRESGPWAFFSLPSRAWELGLGALLALAATRAARIPPRGAVALGLGGLAAILAAAVLFTGTTPFPGVAATLPVLGTVAVLAAGCALPAGGAGRLLSLPGMGFLGGISYSLYLWHWPLLVLPVAYSERTLSGLESAGLVAAAVALAIVTTRFVEDPIRHSRPLGARPLRGFALAVGLTFVGLGTAFAVSRTGELDSGVTVAAVPAGTGVATAPDPGGVPANLRPPLDEATDDRPSSFDDGCHADIGDIEFRGCVYGANRGGPTIALFGDSHAAQWFPAVSAIARRDDMPLLNLTASGCPSVTITVWSDELGRDDLECDRLREDAFAKINEIRPEAVVIANLGFYPMPPGPPSKARRWYDGLTETLDRLPDGTRAFVVADTPHFRVDPPVCLSEHLDDATACSADREEAVAPIRREKDREITDAAGHSYVDMIPVLCPDDRCQVIAWNMLMYRDQTHLTTEFSRALAGDLESALGLDALVAAGTLPSNAPESGV